MNKLFRFHKKTTPNYILKGCTFGIGDTVQLLSTGLSYPRYKNAFNSMRMGQYHFTNYYKSELSLHWNNWCILKNTKWTVLDICLHENSLKILYLIGNPILRCGLLVQEEGLELLHECTTKDYKQNFTWL